MVNSTLIKLDRPRELKFGFGAMKKFQQLTGKQITELDISQISIDVIIQILWVMLLKEEPTLTEEEVVDLIDNYAESTEYVIEKVTEVIHAAFPKLTLEPGNVPNAQTPKANP